MKISWINHAGFIVESGNVVLACDPWIEGEIFHDGWRLLAKSKFTYEDFSKVTHIWFSHEHPDHFNPVNIKKIPAEIRKNITVLYQITNDKKIIDFCKKLNFNVVELPSLKWYELNPNFKLINQNDRFGDSWLGVVADGKTLLNMNDVISFTTKAELNSIAKHFTSIDVLFTQFSYASFAGNKDELEKRKKVALDKLLYMKFQCDFFKPKFVVPFASFVDFCKSSNFYANEGANTIEDVSAFILKNIEAIPVIFYPGDQWFFGQQHSNIEAIEKYKIDQNNFLSAPNLITSKIIPFQELKGLANEFLDRIKSAHNSILLKHKLKNPCNLFIEDLKITCRLNLKGLEIIDSIQEDSCDIVLNSESLAYCFKFNWGGDTLNINACFQVPKKGNINNFKNYFYFSQLLNLGKRYNFSVVVKNVFSKLLKRL